MNKAKLTILGSVPLVMIINLSLLNYYFGHSRLGVTNDESHKVELANNETNNTVYVPKVSYRKKTIKVPVIPPPPQHTFAVTND